MARADRATWAKRVQSWKAGGLSAEAYAAKIGVNPGTLSYWRWRLGSGARAARARPTVTLARRPEPPSSLGLTFVELSRERDALACEPFEVLLARGDRVRVPMSFDAGALGRLLEVLERRP